MADHSHIEWTDRTWNPVTGCTECSASCANCYARGMANRLAGIARARGPSAGRLIHYRDVASGSRWTGKIELVHEALHEPARWRRPSTVFVNSMSDLFHPQVPVDFTADVFSVMQAHPQHRFQVLTKRSARAAELADRLPWPANVWMGVSVENYACAHRASDLRSIPAAVRFLSLEPLLGPLDQIDLAGMHWVIVGGESGARARPMAPAWVTDLRDRCVAQRIPFFFKQWGKLANNPDPADRAAKRNGGTAKGGRQLDGRLWDQTPGAGRTPIQLPHDANPPRCGPSSNPPSPGPSDGHPRPS